MFNHDVKATGQPVQKPTLGGPPLKGVSDAAADTPSPGSLAVDSGGSVGGSPIVPTGMGAKPPQSASAGDDELVSIKQQALTQLSPLIDKLDQTPEEKFRLIMTMIQASDDHSLIKIAYDAAKKIEDEKARAEALLSIVNEVNYFSKKANPSTGEATPSI